MPFHSWSVPVSGNSPQIYSCSECMMLSSWLPWFSFRNKKKEKSQKPESRTILVWSLLKHITWTFKQRYHQLIHDCQIPLPSSGALQWNRPAGERPFLTRSQIIPPSSRCKLIKQEYCIPCRFFLSSLCSGSRLANSLIDYSCDVYVVRERTFLVDLSMACVVTRASVQSLHVSPVCIKKKKP